MPDIGAEPVRRSEIGSQVTIDPADNQGERGEVSVKGWSDGESLTEHPRPDPAAKLEDSASQRGGREVGRRRVPGVRQMPALVRAAQLAGSRAGPAAGYGDSLRGWDARTTDLYVCDFHA